VQKNQLEFLKNQPVRFRFYKSGTEKTELNPNRKKPEKNQAKPEKTISLIKEKWMIVLVCIDDILVFSKNKQEHIGHLQVVFAELINH